MSQIKITLTDAEGRVRVDSDPPASKLLQIAKDRNATPAECYAMAALRKIMEDSRKLALEKMKQSSPLWTPQEPRLIP